ncbi:MAG TPA: hypothetical protein VGQ65_15475, partial [Thermoanaerobaculia bacterium]|nr:hypothetical protein [Thermoanaerobaculia bacterium]
MARPEQVILDQLPVESWDIFIGLLWLRFGSPTGGTDPATGAQFSSGTHEEFKLAYQSWQSTKRPHIMFYRCVRPPTDIDGFDTVQLEQVRDFFKGFAHDKDHPGLHQMFREPDELESQVNTHLTDLLFALGSWGTPQVEIARKEPELALVPGQAYEVVAVSVDIVKHSEMVRRDKTEANHILKWFAECVFGIFARPQWAKISWTPDGGMFITAGEGRHDRAALAGIRLLMEITIRNLESSRLPLAIRVAAVDGQLAWNDNPSLISSETLNFAKHLEDGGTEAGEFCITDTLHLSVSDSVKSAFSHARRFQNRRILAYKSASATEPPTNDTVAKLVAQTTQLLNDLVARHSTPVLNESTQNAT